LALSQFFSKDRGHHGIQLDEWCQHSIVHEVAGVEGENAPSDSLKRLRRCIADRSDAIVVIGGEWWQEHPGRAGVPVELAREHGLPCFLVTGLGFDLVVGQLCRLPLVRGELVGGGGATFRILVLDGGGIKGTFTAAVLAETEWEKLTRRLADCGSGNSFCRSAFRACSSSFAHFLQVRMHRGEHVEQMGFRPRVVPSQSPLHRGNIGVQSASLKRSTFGSKRDRKSSGSSK
jgi:hypothetical protein